MFVRNVYLYDDLFKMSIMTIVTKNEMNNNNNNNTFSSYFFESYDMQHGRLGYMNYNSIQKVINLELLPIIVFEKNHKYKVCVNFKFIQIFVQTIKSS